MVSFISTLLILVLANGYFTLPVSDEKSWSATHLPSFHGLDGEVTENPVMLRYVPNGNDTNELSPGKTMRGLPNNLMESNWPATTESLPEENASRAPRTVKDDNLFETLEHTTELSNMDERRWDESLSTTVESIAEENASQEPRILNNDHHVESSTFTTERSPVNTQGPNKLPLHKVKAYPEQNNFFGRSVQNTTEGRVEIDDENDMDKREQVMQSKSTILSMPLFTSTSSTVASQLYSSTEKHSVLYHADHNSEGDKPMKKEPTPFDDSSATTHGELTNVKNVQSHWLAVDHTNSYVTNLASTVKTITMENNSQEKPKLLNQVQESS